MMMRRPTEFDRHRIAAVAPTATSADYLAANHHPSPMRDAALATRLRARSPLACAVAAGILFGASSACLLAAPVGAVPMEAGMVVPRSEPAPSPAARAVATLIDELTRVNAEMTALRQSLATLQDGLENTRGDFATRLTAVEQSTDADLATLADKTRAAVDGLQAKLEELEDALGRDLSKLTAAHTEVETDLTKVSAALGLLEAASADHRKALDDADGARATLASELDAVQTEVQALTKALEAGAESAQTAASALETALTTHQTDIAQVLDDARARMDQIVAAAAEQTTTLEALSMRVDMLGTTLDALLAEPAADVLARVLALSLAAEAALADGDARTADNHLREAERVALRDPVLQQTLAPAIGEALQSVSGADADAEVLAALQPELHRACTRLSGLPVRPDPTTQAPLARVTAAAPQDSSGWRSVLGGLWKDLIGQIKVTPEADYTARVGGEQRNYAQLALAGMCLTLDDALVARDGGKAQRVAAAMQDVIAATYDQTAAPVIELTDMLEAVGALTLEPYPGLTALRAALASAMAESASTAD